MADLAELGADAVTTEQHYQRGKSRIGDFCRVSLSGFDLRVDAIFLALTNTRHEGLANVPRQAARSR